MVQAPRIDWEQMAQQYTAVDEDRSRIVYPKIVEIVRGRDANSVFDYGGGDGRLVEILLKESQGWITPIQSVACYDPSVAMRELAQSRLTPWKNVAICGGEGPEWQQKWDVVTFVAVWMGLDDEGACADALGRAASLLDEEGLLIAAVTHPCFRDRVFHSYSTDFDMRSYLETGISFGVRIYDEAQTVRLVDTHWNLDAMSRQLGAADLVISRIHELPDVTASSVGASWLLIEAMTKRP